MYAVEWKKTALDELTVAWLDADPADHSAIRDAVTAIDKRLAKDPQNEGESRDHGRRVLFEGPLTVMFRVYPNQKAVDVLKVRAPAR